MKKFNKQHEELMALLDEVPGVKEHMASFEVNMGEAILKRRLEAGLTQAQVVAIVNSEGEKITQATISKVECGDKTIGSDTYNKIFNALGGIKDINIEFGELPKSSKKIIEYEYA
ncbi:hypothetical protein SAMN05880501_1134 [Ureibacillus xyleni]|uniref:HTH cro/C1-type domain-containing protein n=1 Tax=Ureibacillus xyleni TaxID=614648 RepID=A0A285THT0_9BACL|nr:helix-turn-helix transcriptional regulator [Ureibacillus xyleni]SOC21517.1 hypothetical protein SAMN05880501_1134 [Ureibacillus xyleni]